ncbi:hypothetical protein GIB67_022240 [Kingdonia uniflora]|uniref:Uncharacterized protein n=1 Tax=Kingdonia uniflora TaxID=39325 RepID=A0A7J7M7A0_9MAGN|nr:hypothetical protein GIB67_022240 [Kingdonia uniflora]
MKVIAVYLLAVLGGNVQPSAADLKHILGSGKTIEELIAAGREKFAFVSSVGGGSTGLSVPSSAASAPAAAAEEKKEEKVEEDEDEDEEDFDFDLFKDDE